MKVNPLCVKKIAIFRALQLGDILCAIPAIKAVRKSYPNAKIYFIGLPHTKGLIFRFAAYIDDFIDFPGYKGLPEQPFDEEKFADFLKEMQNHQFDLVMQMQGNGTIVNEMLKSFNAKYLAGFAINDTELKDNELLLAYPNTGHESLRHLSLAKHLNLIVEDEAMEYPVINDDEKALHKLNLPLQAQQYVCIHAGSRGAWRQWPITYFAALADICIKNGLKIVLTGTPNELEIANQLAKHIDGNCINLAGKTHLGSIGALLKNAALLIANCTGVSHIAAGLKTPSLIISMDGEPERWAPLNNHLHYTIDWTKNADYQLVEATLIKQLEQLTVPSPL